MQKAPFEMSNWQKIQVTLLYHFASLDYLKNLQKKVHGLMMAVNPTLDLAKAQQRDALLTDTRWGARNTAGNWENNGWAYLADFELSITTQISKISLESYSITGTNQCERGLSELSLQWMTQAEQDDFESRLEEISNYALALDETMNQHEKAGRWDDFSLTLASRDHSEALDSAPALRLRPDVTATSGITPPRTGVYLPIDDPNGAPQFCWTGNPPGKLLECTTLNALGMKALQEVGRKEIWVNEDLMHAFVQKHLNDPLLTRDDFFSDSITDPALAPSLVARNAFTTRPCTWIYVEQINGESEKWEDSSKPGAPTDVVRLKAGELCNLEGYYFSPAKPDSRRYFSKGELMPNIGGDYGLTFWQWDINQ
ncbi:hypothetical protein [Duganella sp. Leaf126]|uniref:hypothetical protein n=1 Tax=Duganella sp. Leaf126 TaxID=1736266 RepID=UPI0009E99D1B|nr:hypothetical protein [Duganella sp. Leaf126]